MADIVFILGAGASVAGGAPLMNGFLDRAEDLLANGRVDDAAEDFRAVFNARSLLQAMHSKASLSINNLEHVFSLFSAAQMLGSLGTLPPVALAGLAHSMRLVIARTLEESVLFPQGSPPESPRPYGGFVGTTLARIRASTERRRSVAIMTFNYDVGLDYALHRQNIPFSYCLEATSSGSDVALLKLHGSLNWTRCATCGAVLMIGMDEAEHHFQPPVNGYRRLLLSAGLRELEHCGTHVEGDPVIIPPTWRKSDDYGSLKTVWQRSARELSEANEVIVVGYSLPSTDIFFPYLYALGTIGNRVLRRFLVVDPDEGAAARFKELLGPGATERFTVYPHLFDHAIGTAVMP